MITDDIFEELRKVHTSLTENEFTTRYLKASRSYLCNRRNQKRDVSNNVLLNLYAELKGQGSVWHKAVAGEQDERRRMRWQQMAELHTELAQRVANRVLERAGSRTPDA
ncbi:DUF6626 family protein [Haliea sp. E1-2-M8]|uniref:DUF6626 family protein n=1 Tax=Haliea sp. E1-2-M8 TaxID=3064706 RepID=UPI00351C0CF0